MKSSRAAWIGAFAASMTLAWASGAAASSGEGDVATLGVGYSAADAPLGSAAELRIDLLGRVEARCELTTPPGPMGQLRLSRPGEVRTGFGLDCNTPFVLRVRSQSGAFRSVDPGIGTASELPYEISVAVGTDRGRQDLGWCASSALTETPDQACAFGRGAADRGWSSQDATAIDQKGELRLRWSTGDAERPLLGDYGDVIVIEIEVRS